MACRGIGLQESDFLPRNLGSWPGTTLYGYFLIITLTLHMLITGSCLASPFRGMIFMLLIIFDISYNEILSFKVLRLFIAKIKIRVSVLFTFMYQMSCESQCLY